ncbi:glycosyltransferase family protein [Butyrivibrio sp. VCB2006]|uniref:glycosyltransferase family protein n=1 Tax=Butyrivibrio sp. VCB2006 TaxID=1280679 RepID=UPI00040B82EE|nr:glycosyltransferase [Butyrivibrio sp. VCB2006]
MITEKDLHIIVFTGLHPVLSFFVEQLIKYLDTHGVDYYLADAEHPETYNSPAFQEYVSKENVAVFMFNNIGASLSSNEGVNLWKERGIPVFDCLVDHPRSFEDTLKNPPCDIYAFALDYDHVSYMRKYYPKLAGIYFSPNGGTSCGTNTPFAERSIDVLYTGNCHEPILSFPKIDFMVDGGEEYYQYTIRSILANPSLSVDEIIDQYISLSGMNTDNEKSYYLKAETGAFIETVARRKTKLEGMKALDEAGVHVEIFGGSWICDDYPFSSNISVHDRIDIHELLPKISDSKITLCFMPWFKKGSSEKVFDAMLNGSLCVTDYSDYLGFNYRDGYNIIFFDLNNPKQMAADIKWLLDNPKAAEKIALNGYNTAISYDTWNSRFDFIIDRILSVF